MMIIIILSFEEIFIEHLTDLEGSHYFMETITWQYSEWKTPKKRKMKGATELNRYSTWGGGRRGNNRYSNKWKISVQL